MHQRHIVQISIRRTFEEAYAFLADPLTYPKWAAVDGSTYRQVGPLDWAASTDFGERLVRFCERNSFGILDHAVYREGDTPVMMPMRVIPNGRGCELSFVFFRRPDFTNEQFVSAVEWVTADFLGLKALLEI